MIPDDAFDPKSTVVFANCKGCTFELHNLCTKVFIQGCTKCKFKFNSKVYFNMMISFFAMISHSLNTALCCLNTWFVVKIVTHMCEVYKCKDIKCEFTEKIGTMQVDMSKKLDFKFSKKDEFG